MSTRGGRGGGRGGRGGAGRGPPGTTWDSDLYKFVTRTPQADYPELKLHRPKPMDDHEERAVIIFERFRDTVHRGPLYTRARYQHNPLAPDTAAYTQEQINERYKISKATADAFDRGDRYSDRFKLKPRLFPDFKKGVYVKSLWPKPMQEFLEKQGANFGDREIDFGKADNMAPHKDHLDLEEEKRRKLNETLAQGEDEDDLNLNLQADEIIDDGIEDDAFEEEDDDDGNDYNAQGYWEEENNDDADDFDGGGDADDGEYF
ncbi:hypothetical protein MKZ38_002038 [Zalerion maritima]|uniref:DNA-directed RNA polymerase III subunit n=1 Tax=Zalerion maritima TaxID=339359 RepID=A0AAD5RXH9_9PEZI|nr:hypothetical protein MKZ38_002038 [Zalerion maritima]